MFQCMQMHINPCKHMLRHVNGCKGMYNGIQCCVVVYREKQTDNAGKVQVFSCVMAAKVLC